MKVRAYKLLVNTPGKSNHLMDLPMVGGRISHANLSSRIESFDFATGIAVLRLDAAIDFKPLEDAGVPWSDIVDFE